MTVEEGYGGSDFDATAVALVHEELSYSDPAFCLSYLAHSLLFVNNLQVNGSHEQKSKFLPNACNGSSIGGMGMSEPNAGTDVLGMKTNASIDEEAGGWILNGTKVSVGVICWLCLLHVRASTHTNHCFNIIDVDYKWYHQRRGYW